MIPSCKNDSKLITPAFAPMEELQPKLNISGEEESLLVCQKQYRDFSLQPCAGCGIKPKQGTKFTRHCPNLNIISQFLDDESIIYQLIAFV